MKVKVVRQFRDKHTNVLHKIGDELIINKKRFEEIQSVSYIYVKEVKKGEK